MNYTAREAEQEGFAFRINGQNCKIMSYNGEKEQLVIPSCINGKPVRVIGTGAFCRRNIKSIVLPDTVRVIRKDAFKECPLENVELPAEIKRIEENAFGWCRVLSKVTLRRKREENDSIREIEVNESAFSYTPYIEKFPFVILEDILLKINTSDNGEFLKIPDGVRVIADKAMGWNSRIKKIEIPLSVKKIGKRAFARAWKLEKIFFEESNELIHALTIEKEAFGSLFYPKAFYESFIWKTITNMLNSAPENGSGWIQFKNIQLLNIDGSSSMGEKYIYIPYSQRRELWEQIQLIYNCWRDVKDEFYLRLDLFDYYAVFRHTKNLKEQLKMAECMAQNGYGAFEENAIDFIRIHINKAVEYAVRDNQKDSIRLYYHKNLLCEEMGVCVRRVHYLVEKYQNETAKYLRESCDFRF